MIFNHSGRKEDIVEIILNLKIRFKLYSDEPQVLSLKAKGRKSFSRDIEVNPEVEIVSSSAHILSLTGKNAEVKWN